MPVLDSILQFKPNTWDYDNYSNVRFVKVPLSEKSAEYKEIQSEFLGKYGENTAIIKIERIQHPFAYGAFRIRKEHLQKLHGHTPEETRKFFPISDGNKIQQILESNCDSRIASTFEYSYVTGLTGEYVLVTKTFTYHGFNSRDSNHYPEYLIQHGSVTSGSTDLLGLRLRGLTLGY